MSPRVRFEPLGEEIDCGAEETVLDAAFRQGYNLAHGCREGQCSACKCYLLEGEVDLKRYSSFALSDTERSNGYALMCRAVPDRDLVVELLHYDPDNYRLENAIRNGVGTVREIRNLTHDIVGVTVDVDELAFVPGQYIDIHVPGGDGAKRSFSIANLPGEGRIELMIKRYPGGRLSGMLGERIVAGSELSFTGPYGAFHLRHSERPILMIAGGSGMAPVLSVLRQLAGEGCRRPVRFFYGAREERDLFSLQEIARLGERLADFSFAPVTGRFVHEAVEEFLKDGSLSNPDVYMCGPPPMLEAAEEMLAEHGVEAGQIFQDRFTTSADAAADAPAEPTPPADAAVSEREFQWFSPRARRASLYEDVTIDTQPSIHRHLRRGWPVSFEDGRGTWNDASTALRSRDWFAFRDPGENWERTFYQAGTAVEQQIDSALRSAAEQGLIADFAPAWVEFLRSGLQVPAFIEHGLWFALATAARDALSDSVATCMCLQAAMKQRSAQAIVLYAMDLEPHLEQELPIEAARDSFLGDPAWQPARRYLERLAATPDWAEVLFAANLCFEPTVATLIRRELGIRAASASGDSVTPVLARVATQEWEWTRAWTVELSQFLLAEGDGNRAVLAAWVRDWLPEALEAVAALSPLAESVGVDFAQAVRRVHGYAGEMLAEAGLAELCELVGHEPASAPLPSPATARSSQPTPRSSQPTARSSQPSPGTPAPSPGTPPPSPGTPAPSPGTPPPSPEPHRPGWLASQPSGGPQTPPQAGPDAAYDFVGIVMAKSAEGDAVARFLARRDEVEVIEQPSFWDIRARDRLAIPYQEVTEEVGYEIDAYSIQHEMSTHYGRMVATDDALMLFSDPTEAMEHLLS